MSSEQPDVEGRYAEADEFHRRRWFLDHISAPPAEIFEFLSGTSVNIDGSRVLDVGCGDGILDLGMTKRFRPIEMVGTDLFMPDIEELSQLSKKFLNEALPTNLRFVQCTESSLPFPDSRFDFVMSWSVFEHVSDPVRVLKEIRRVLRPRGYMFLQIWPLFHSQRGSHLWKWYPDGWEHLLRSHSDLEEEMFEFESQRPALLKAMMEDFRSLNRLTVSELQASLSSAGLTIRRVSAQSDTIDIPESLLRYPLTDLILSGIKILAVRS